MRVSELSGATGVPVATIKYYLREGLLPRGERTARNQASYTDAHVERLRLIRALTDIGGMSIKATRKVLASVDDAGLSANEVLAVAHGALAPHPGASPSAELKEVNGLIERLGWDVDPRAPDRAVLAEALAALRGSGWDVGAEVFEGYARAAGAIAAQEIRSLSGLDRERLVKNAVVGSVLFGSVLASMRRMAQEHHSKQELGGT